MRNTLMLFLLTTFVSCKAQKIPAKSYSVFFGPPEQANSRCDFISYKDCLFEFRLRQNRIAVINAQTGRSDSASHSYDTTSIILIFKGGTQFFEFDKFAANAVMQKTGNAASESPGMIYTARAGQTGDLSHKFNAAADTAIGGTLMKKIDTLVQEQGINGIVSFCYIPNEKLLTVFNIRDQVKNIKAKYCFAGYLFYPSSQMRPEGIIISGLKDLDDTAMNTCSALYKKALSKKKF